MRRNKDRADYRRFRHPETLRKIIFESGRLIRAFRSPKQAGFFPAALSRSA
jgi:hypothetical protein